MISRGHGFDDLFGKYTIDQFWLFFRAAKENEKRKLLDFTVAVRIAFGADKKEWKNFINDMSKQDKPKQSSKEEIEKIGGLFNAR